MFPAKVAGLFIVSIMMTSTAVVAGPGPFDYSSATFYRFSLPDVNAPATILTVATETVVQESTVAQMASVESAPEDNSKIVHATSVTRSMGLAMMMAAWVSTRFALVEGSKDALVTSLWTRRELLTKELIVGIDKHSLIDP
ncbi:hypothetical protein L218DRAFT_949801 [Marasmius fiardii PR-910]|nr:hypothetical protein L218DRAFT_949801 [Marasmius fiardii PR-910]